MLFAAVGAIAAACGSELADPTPVITDGTDGGTQPVVDGGVRDATTEDASEVDGGSGGKCDTHCSADLLSVVDCKNQLVMMCPPGQGCGANGCMPACEAAVQAKSSIGCEYYAVAPDIIADAKGACFAAYLTNAWNQPITIQVERAGTTLPDNIAYLPQGSGQSITYQALPNGQLMPGQVAVVFLSGSPSAPIGRCPAGVNVGYPQDPSVNQTGIGDAFHITTSAPVVAYDIFPFGGGNAAATSATLLLPTGVWDTNYIAVDAYAQSQLVSNAAPSMDIVASVDNTHVTIVPTVAIVGGGGVSAAPAKQPVVYTLNKGQYLQISQPAELIGSVIEADQPVGHWGGASCLNIPANVAACDSAHQQIPPLKALGHEYVAVRYRNRFDGKEESPPWRVVGAVDGTVLSYDPAPPKDAPLALERGEFFEFRASGPFTVKSQDDTHPFYMAAFMTGCAETNPDQSDCRGDPEFVNVIPPQQYRSSYTFFTDPTYPETNLILVRGKGTGQGQFEDVSLDCAGTITGWAPVGAAGDYEYARLDLVTGNFKGQNGCDNGIHTIKSNGMFGLTVWGWGSAASGSSFGCSGSVCGGLYSQAVSYAYPAGAGVWAINQVTVPTTSP
ncbi:hypothetical protein AKJ09_05898 [Labilithrix luteola]|uniref:IgGFc-binding protein N-terminal domain-containing protein n=1 Tax=Labilithrix luteola TaxID=1391654 RepID=A0A0K1Q1G2_9BACT|nr:hypothetical protein AKJ09_05898 [Labilithrix luteola]